MYDLIFFFFQQEGQIANMENRNYYSLHCLQMETQLVYAHLDIFCDVLKRMTEVEAQASEQVCFTFVVKDREWILFLFITSGRWIVLLLLMIVMIVNVCVGGEVIVVNNRRQ